MGKGINHLRRGVCSRVISNRRSSLALKRACLGQNRARRMGESIPHSRLPMWPFSNHHCSLEKLNSPLSSRPERSGVERSAVRSLHNCFPGNGSTKSPSVNAICCDWRERRRNGQTADLSTSLRSGRDDKGEGNYSPGSSGSEMGRRVSIRPGLSQTKKMIHRPLALADWVGGS
jgi:hypothetical protein